MRRYTVIGLSIFITAALWANSFFSDREVSYNADTIVMKVGGQEVNVSEVMIHFLLWRDKIESKWGTSMWNAQTGTDKDGEPITYEDDIKEDIEKEIEAEKGLKQEAQKQDLYLTKAEKEECREKAEETIRTFSNEEVLRYEITVEKLSEHFEDIQLGSKLCKKKMNVINETYDQENYLMTTIHVILFSTEKTDQKGNQTEMSQQEKKELKQEAEQALGKIKSGKSLDEVAKQYDLAYDGKQSFLISGEGNIDGWEQFKDLKNGEVSEVITTSYGYMIVQMVDRVDEEKSQKALENAREKAREEEILQYYEEKYQDDYRMRTEEDIWEVLPLASGDE